MIQIWYNINKSSSWRGVLDTTLCNKVCQWLGSRQRFSPVSSNNKTEYHDITEKLMKVALNSIIITLESSRNIVFICTIHTMIHKPQYLDVLSSEIEKSLYKICLLYIYKDTFIYIIQILYRYFSIISLEKTSKYCVFVSCRRGRRGRDRVVVGFTTTYAISAYHHTSCEF
jgi:hypothetical protein